MLRPLIVDMVPERGSTTPTTPRRWLGLGPDDLTGRCLSPMGAEGVPESRYPTRVNHPDQAYRVKPAPFGSWPARRPAHAP